VSRSVRAGAEDVLVTQGAQQALDLIGRVLLGPGAVVAMEEPGYPQARPLFRSLGARIVPVPVDEEGMDAAALPADAALVYTTPSHQYPLGTPMSLARRTALLDWASDHDAVIVEDDYDSEYRFSERPLEPLQSIDRNGRVIYVGSFAKTVLPMLRLGFLVPPASLRSALHSAKQLTDWYGDLVTQGAMAHFLDEGLMARHLRRATHEYAARHELINSTLNREFTDWLAVVPSAAGLHLCAKLIAPVDLEAVRAVAARSGVELGWLAESCDTLPAQQGVVLGYGMVDPARIADGMRRLAEAFRQVSSNGADVQAGAALR
jgi:GntR family transcriptional regulator/MocR family aminotransferase